MVLMRFAKWMVPFCAYEYPQIREKPLRSKSAASDGVGVRVWGAKGAPPVAEEAT